jgi:integrase/recombinase XerD
MARMEPPKVEQRPPPVLREDELRRLVAVCEKDPTFEGRRDAATMRVLIDTGGRRAEVAGLRWTPEEETTNDLDLDQGAYGCSARAAGCGSCRLAARR